MQIEIAIGEVNVEVENFSGIFKNFRCPDCNFRISVEFNETEIRQRGKNEFCPHCGALLWIPFQREKPFSFGRRPQ
jgi:uncharacterized protein with PIN domain